VKNFDAMALKTCVIKALKLCPISIETLRAVQTEEIVDYNDTAVEVTPEAENVTYSVSEEPRQIVAPAQTEEPAPSDMAQEALESGMSAEDEAAMNAAFDSMPPQAQDPSEIF
jgi:recombinational DNA repair protein RecT